MVHGQLGAFVGAVGFGSRVQETWDLHNIVIPATTTLLYPNQCLLNILL